MAKNCRKCAEEIQSEAKICRYCGSRQTPLLRWPFAVALLASVGLAWYFGAVESPSGSNGGVSRLAAADRALDVVRDQLLDPQSAQFSDTYVSKTGHLCGLVNSKNRFGGMAGNTEFVASGSFVMIRSRKNAREFKDYWNASCNQN